MPAFASLASLLLASGTIASLDLCADEYLLVFAKRDQIASVSVLAADPSDSVLHDRARGIPTNRGTLESLLSSGARTLLTTRPLARLDRKLAERLGMTVATLETGSPGAVSESVDTVAALTGRKDRARMWHGRLDQLRARVPANRREALWIGPGGIGMSADGAAAEWLAFAGIHPIATPPGLSRVEQVVTTRAPLVLRSDYRKGQFSFGSATLDHPLVRRAGSRQIVVDGRRFICSGPLLLDEIERLRGVLAR